MTCLRDNNQGADLLIGYLEGTLSEAERTELERHTAVCEDCRGLLAVQAELDVYEAPEVSPGFDARLYTRIAAEETAAKPWWHLSWKLAAPAAAAAVAAMLAVAVWVRQPEPVPVAEEPVVSLEVQQLEQALDDLELLMPLNGGEPL